MIIITDNVLPEKTFKNLQKYCNNVDFIVHKVGDKEFLIANTPEEILSKLKVEGYKIILTFIRKAHHKFDTDYRIHADGIISGQKTELASVLYINGPGEVSDNGTAFYDHCVYGSKLPENVSENEFNRLLTEDSNAIKKWKETNRVVSRPNRLLLYDAQMFHAKWPKVIRNGERKVLVTFYARINK